MFKQKRQYADFLLGKLMSERLLKFLLHPARGDGLRRQNHCEIVYLVDRGRDFSHQRIADADLGFINPGPHSGCSKIGSESSDEGFVFMVMADEDTQHLLHTFRCR